MRRKALFRIAAYLALGLLLLGAKCPGIPDTHEVNLTLVTEEFIEFTFSSHGSVNVDEDTESIDVADIRNDLLDAGVDLSRVDEIRVSAVDYGTVTYGESGAPPRVITGNVWIEYNSTTETLVDLASQNVPDLLGILVPAPIDEDGIDFLNLLMADVLDAIQTGSPATLQVTGGFDGVSTPTERETNFSWRVRFYFHISGQVVTDVPSF
jgi:hypothetical protein